LSTLQIHSANQKTIQQNNTIAGPQSSYMEFASFRELIEEKAQNLIVEPSSNDMDQKIGQLQKQLQDWYDKWLSDSAKSSQHLEQAVKFSFSNQDLNLKEIIALQALTQQYALKVHIMAKLIETSSATAKTTLQTQA